MWKCIGKSLQQHVLAATSGPLGCKTHPMQWQSPQRVWFYYENYPLATFTVTLTSLPIWSTALSSWTLLPELSKHSFRTAGCIRSDVYAFLHSTAEFITSQQHCTWLGVLCNSQVWTCVQPSILLQLLCSPWLLPGCQLAWFKLCRTRFWCKVCYWTFITKLGTDIEECAFKIHSYVLLQKKKKNLLVAEIDMILPSGH